MEKKYPDNADQNQINSRILRERERSHLAFGINFRREKEKWKSPKSDPEQQQLQTEREGEGERTMGRRDKIFVSFLLSPLSLFKIKILSLSLSLPLTMKEKGRNVKILSLSPIGERERNHHREEKCSLREFHVYRGRKRDR